ncbi:signal recognition particle-docking protein FtsY [Thalassobacillus pellis]|uniref:signal recognition particle-docking protein FtsY n=1 Tax=Thalassobacillus pellis TaxID=748008 RepID=UPI001960F024|nr:signal recognition particle-docking protein FtsY [Thalassobacillus pellis]MBM7552779.1 fused signal recognition particle receptor [Thalassobacillus pellis]
MSFFKKLKEKFITDPFEQDLEEYKKEQEASLEEDETFFDEAQEKSSDDAFQAEEDTSSQEPAEDTSAILEEDDLEVEEEEEETLQPESVDTLPKEEPEEGTIASKFKLGLTKTRDSFSGKINDLVARYRTVDEDFFEDLEEILISADVGVTTVMDMIDELKMEVKRRNIKDTRKVREVISEKLVEIYYGDDDSAEIQGLNINHDGLSVILFVGVNGVGKTTTIGKLAYQLKQEGKNVLLAAGDTFRAGAIEQLDAWGERVGVNVVKHSAGSDPAAVIFDAIQAAKSRNADVLLCDTAGRLQNKVNLMNELSKVKRVISREIPTAPHEVLLVLDATTGQNAMSQAKTFSEATDVSGIVLTKLDGTAKGGIVLAIRNELEIPVKMVGLGEKMTDLQEFDAHAFVYGLFADMVEAYEEDEE